ncbi:DUF3899 domain-containing protein [Caloranaerobacter sp. DY30410]|uniref:DUF3899 domain-containing protein n=1 Tax=Caloranaerobacter sp. DY30410 TaxID=3238305 RepID=UPI003D073B02
MRILTAITTLFTLLYIILNKNYSFIFKLSNAFFILGLIYLCIALIVHIRNVGFLKLLSYHRYRRKQNSLIKPEFVKDDSKDSEGKIMKFHEFCREKYKKQWSNAIFYKFSIPLLFISLVLALIIKCN